MKLLVLMVLLFMVVFDNCSGETNEDFRSDMSQRSVPTDDIKTLHFSEELRSKKCTERNHECTDDRHSCCRGKLFKDVCMCFYPEGGSNDTARANKELCTCQQPGHYKTIEKVFDKTKVLVNKAKGLVGL